ncbi:MAG TPA: glycosyltransferase family 4 protein [Usitatibacter sp.]|nr:glycosyltransferase family 4 protein [Usitatibacter sp.]
MSGAVAARPALRILHTESSLGWGGQEIRVLTEARGVAARGHAVLLAAAPGSRILAEAPAFGVEAVALPIARRSPRGLLALRRLLARRATDVVNTHSSTDTWLAALACATLPHAPAIVRTRHISAPAPRNAATRWLYTKAADRIVTTGERLREQVIEETGAEGSRVVSIPTGIDLARYQPGDRGSARTLLGLPAGAPIVGIVATLRSWKGHRHLLRAMAALEAREALLVIVGDGPQRAALESLAAELPLAGRVRFAGNQADVVPWMQAFDVFCLPSYANEGVPQALTQAMACALPVVSTPIGSIGEIVTNGETGVLVAPGDVEGLRVALDALLADAARREALGRRAQAAARERFGEDRMVERMIEVFRTAAKARHG